MEYYVVLRSLLRSYPHPRLCLKRCRHCGIFFLTHPCNAGRKDLRCPFGCRAAHRNRRSTERSVAYYSTEEGKTKKRTQNAKRRRRAEMEPDEDVSHADAGDGEWNEQMVGHVRMVTSLIEGRLVSLEEILRMLRRALRQHSLGTRRRIDYIVGHLNKASP